MYWFYSATEAILRFMDMGGIVLWMIAVLLFIMWMLIFERVWYFRTGWKSDVSQIIANWEGRPERKSWQAHAIRRKMIGIAGAQIDQYMPVIKTLVALCPLFGLLGTVVGMIEVFNVMAVTGGADAKSMAGGVSRATVPTMAGMVAALSGVFANTYLTRTTATEKTFLKDNLTTDH